MNNIWSKSGDVYNLSSASQDLDKLEVGIYKVAVSMMGEHFLVKTGEKYEFPYKVYGLETAFIDRVLKTFKHTVTNLGILMNGVKGTGKTVTAMILANNLNLPIIVVDRYSAGLVNFLNNIHQEITIFVDEYEKVFDSKDYSILTLMNGVNDNGHRKVFLLTTNDLYVNPNMLQRPGRVRYLKTYNDLSLDVINEVVDDKLKYPDLKEATVKFISKLKTITIDVINAIIDEVNIHEEDPTKFADIFNVAINNLAYNIYKVIPGKDPSLLTPSAQVADTSTKNAEFKIEDFQEYDSIYINCRYVGTITSIDDDVYGIDDGERQFKYKIEPVSPLHISFMIS